MNQIQNRYTPLQIVLGLGILFRLLAVIFSKGFGWFDDHFLVIEASQSWVDGYDYNYWLPDPHHPERQPQGHPLFYVGIHYYIFKFFSFIGLHDPQLKMTLIRALHAGWSLFIIIYGYKIAEKLSGKKIAVYVGCLLSLYWFMPFLSVRNLVEFVCIPPLLIATWLMLDKKELKWFFIAGLWLGIAFSIRFQSLFYSSGIAISLLIYRTPIKRIAVCLCGFIMVLLITQGVVDYILWKKPFAEFSAYVQYNIDNAKIYGNNVWHMYFDLILGLLIPPVSILLFIGWLKGWKKAPVLFWPVFIYLLFHTCFPNKQERFVVTIIPTLIIAGTIGGFEIYERLKFLKPKLTKIIISCAAVLNLIFLCTISVTYTKRSRVEAMSFLRKQPDLNMVMVDDSNRGNDFTMPPLYYLGKWHSVIGVTKQFYLDSVQYQLKIIPDSVKPNYIIFWRAENINARVDSFRRIFPKIRFITTVEPGLIDKALNRLNPMNDNETAYIYKLNE